MKSFTSKKIIFSTILVAVAIVGGFFVLNSYEDNTNDEVGTTSDQAVPEQSTENSPIEDTSISEQSTNQEQNSSSPTPKPSGPIVTTEYVQQNSNAINVSAFSDHTQAGTCKAVFTKAGDTVVSKEVNSYINAAGKNICDFPVGVKCVDSGGGNTVCTDPFINRSEFPTSGDWQVVVTFNSGSVSATSAPKSITII